MFYGLLADSAAQSILEYIWDNFWSIIAYVIPAISVAAAFVVGLVKGLSKRKFFKILAHEVCGQKSIKKENNKNGYDLFYRFRHYTPHKFSNRKGGDERGISYRQFCKKAAVHNKIVIFAPSGAGKSLLMQKLAYKWRKKILKKSEGKTLKSYNVLFYIANKAGTVENLIKKISNDIAENNNVKYSIFIDGFDELAQFSGRSGDELFNEFLNRIESYENGIIISSACKRIVVSMRPEIITEGFAVKDIFDDYDIQLWDIDRFTAKQTLKMYKSESRLSRENHAVRKQNVKKLQAYFKSESVGDNSVFSYPFIITWLPEVFKDIPQEEIEHYSLYDILDIIVANDCRREYKILYKSGMQNQSAYEQFSTHFYAFIKFAALYMCKNNTSRITAEEVVSLRPETEVQGAGETALLSHRLLMCNDGASVTYQFIHNLIYWFVLAETISDANFERSKRVEILKAFSLTPLAKFYHCAIWEKYKGCFSYYTEKSLGNSARAKNEFIQAVKNKRILCYSIDSVDKDLPAKPTITHEQTLSLLHEFDFITLDGIEYTLGGKVLKKYPVNKGKLSYTVPAPVEEISELAFNCVTYLKDIIIDNCVKKISKNAFYGCSIKTVIIGDSVKVINNAAFINCTVLNNVTIGKGLIIIGYQAFSGCTSLKNIEIPDNVTTIEKQAFLKCMALKDVKIGKGVTTIGEHAFDGCTSLESIEIPDNVTTIEEDAFIQCTALKDVKIGKGVTTIGKQAYAGCTSLESIEIPDNVTTIEEAAFLKCTALKDVKIGKGLKNLEHSVFEGCKSLISIEVDKENEFFKSIDGNMYSKDGIKLVQYAIGKKEPKFIIPDYVTTIGKTAFLTCTSLEGIDIPDNVITINEYAFVTCTALKKIKIGKGVTTIGDFMFSRCSSLESIEIPDNVTTIEKSAFMDCTGLKDIKIGKGVTTIGEYAFDGCTSLESIEIPDNVTTIENGSFEECTALKDIKIGKGVTTIGGMVYAKCTSLEGIDIPDNVTTIEKGAFLVCTALKKVMIGKGVIAIGYKAFYQSDSLAEVYYRGSKKEWNNISIGGENKPLLNATRYYYSESEPDFSDGEKYWRYGENSEILIWGADTTDSVNS